MTGADSRSTRARNASRSPSRTARTIATSSGSPMAAGVEGIDALVTELVNRRSRMVDLHAVMPADDSTGMPAIIGGRVGRHDPAFVTLLPSRTDQGFPGQSPEPSFSPPPEPELSAV